MAPIRNKHRRILGVALGSVVLLAIGFSGCGGSGHSHTATSGSDRGTAASRSLSPATSGSDRGTAASRSLSPAHSATIQIHNFAFSPSKLTVAPGALVRVHNQDSVTHTLTSTSKAFNTGDVGSGQTKTFKAPTKPGTYPYICEIHQYMQGTLIVK